MSSLAVKNETDVELNASAKILLDKFKNSFCAYDDEEIFIEYFYSPRVVTSDIFNPPEQRDEQKVEQLVERLNRLHREKIRRDTEFQMKFKTRFIESSNLERNVLYKHRERIWKDWRKDINRF